MIKHVNYIYTHYIYILVCIYLYIIYIYIIPISMTSGLELSVLSTCGLPWPRLDSFSRLALVRTAFPPVIQKAPANC